MAAATERFKISKAPHYAFNGTVCVRPATSHPDFFQFDGSSEFEALVHGFTRKAENIVREEKDLPRVGEGWISETNLFSQLTAILPEFEVVHHASPDWLGRQHLDVFVPALSLAFEYQGEQHDRPVEYFGGLSAFEQQRRRDSRKANLCRRHGVRLVYIREGYDLSALKVLVDEHLPDESSRGDRSVHHGGTQLAGGR